MLSSSFWRSITLAELWSIRSMSMRLEVVRMTGVFGCSRITTGRLPMWSRWQCVMMMRSSVRPRSGFRSGVAARPTFFGLRPQSTRTFRSPSWMNNELAPMPPSRFRSVSFIQRRRKTRTRLRTSQKLRNGVSRESKVARPGARDRELERREDDVDLVAEIIDAVKTAVGRRVEAGDMITVVGKLLARREARRLAPGEEFSYNSYHVTGLDATAHGSFHGVDDLGHKIHVILPPFELAI